MIVCVNCGQVNETAAARCLRCGAAIFELPSYLGQPDAPPHTRPVSPPPAPTTQPQPPPAMFPPPVVRPMPVGRPPTAPGGFVCPYCLTHLPPRVAGRVSTAGWITLVILLLFCWPLFWIGLLIREERCVCRVCGGRLG